MNHPGDPHANADPARFWRGFGFAACPNFKDASVLEIGCGGGQRILDVASHGAARAVGVDPMAESIEAARRRASVAPGADGRVAFFHGVIDALPEERFDAIISEDTLEHVLDVPDLLASIRRRLKPDGRCHVGFGPLYHAPDGDHGWLRATLPGWPGFIWPWGHLMFERHAFRKLSKLHGRTVDQTRDWPYLSLNQHTVDDYRRMFAASGMRVAFMRTNVVASSRGRMIAALASIPSLRKYCTLNMFVTLAND